MADGSPSSPPPRKGLTDASLASLVLQTWPVAAINSDAGLAGRGCEPRLPGTGGDQRDAASALELASDAGRIEAHRLAHARMQGVTPGLRPYGEWLAQWGFAVAFGARASVAMLSERVARDLGPPTLSEAADLARDRAQGAEVRYAAAKGALRGGMTVERAKELESARMAYESAAARSLAENAELVGWGRDRLEAFAEAWEATAPALGDEGSAAE